MASGTNTHNALFQQNSSRFTFFWECMQRNKARPLLLRAESMLRLCDWVYLDMSAHQSVFFSYGQSVISHCQWFLSFMLDSRFMETLQLHEWIFFLLANSLFAPKSIVLTAKAQFSFSKEAYNTKKRMPYWSQSQSLLISSCYVLFIQTLAHRCLFPQQWVVSIYFLFPCSCTSKWSVCPE